MELNWQKAMLVVMVGLLAVGAGVTATRAQDGEQADEGTVIRIGPDGGGAVEGNDPLPSEVDPRPRLQRQFQPWLLPGDPNQIMRQRRPASPYYIGVAATKVSDQVRAHVDIPDEVGLIVLQVFDGSPADEGGLKEHDILLTADGTELRELDDLINVVEEHATDGNMTQFTLDVIRHGQPQTVWVTPAERPQPDEIVQPGFGPGMPELGIDQGDLMNRLFKGRGGNFGFAAPGFDLDQVPGNVSVQIQKQGDEPAKITISRDGETWEVVGDDPESLNALPEDLRPMVEQMLNGNEQGFEMGGAEFGGEFPQELRERLREMEEQMQELQQRFQQQSQE